MREKTELEKGWRNVVRERERERDRQGRSERKRNQTTKTLSGSRQT